MFKTLAGLETSDDDTEIDETEPIKELEVEAELHYLNRQWDLWYHDPNNNDYSLASYINLGTLDTIEKFWHYYYQLKLTQLQNGMFFLMVKGVLPTWEDNLKGGCWSYKIDKKEISQAWTKISIHLLSDNFVEKDDNNPELNNEIIGISISPKKTFSILKVWVNNDSQHEKVKIIDDLPFIKNETPIYRSHIETKQKEEEIKSQTQ
jgi:hypothetical protein